MLENDLYTKKHTQGLNWKKSL